MTGPQYRGLWKSEKSSEDVSGSSSSSSSSSPPSGPPIWQPFCLGKLPLASRAFSGLQRAASSCPSLSAYTSSRASSVHCTNRTAFRTRGLFYMHRYHPDGGVEEQRPHERTPRACILRGIRSLPSCCVLAGCARLSLSGRQPCHTRGMRGNRCRHPFWTCRHGPCNDPVPARL